MVFKRLILAAAMLCGARAFAQPNAPAGAELPCQAAAGSDEVSIQADSGFVKIFDGTSFKGWWHNCQSEDAGPNREQGGIWKVDPVEHAIYSMQRDDGSGSMLVTNKKYDNQEIILDVWPDFGNDAGIFHRTTDKGRSFQTVVDYLPNNCIGGTWAQEMPFTFYKHPYLFGSNEKTIVSRTGWAYTGAWLDVWDPDTWNQVRVKFYGHNPTHHQTWIRKVGAAQWTPVIDLEWPEPQSSKEAATGYIGFQVHFADGSETRWNRSGKGNWYRNILVRELNEDGSPKAAGIRAVAGARGARLIADGSELTGILDRDYAVTVRDLAGRRIDAFQGRAGDFSHALPAGRARGILLVELRAGNTSVTVRVAPL